MGCCCCKNASKDSNVKNAAGDAFKTEEDFKDNRSAWYRVDSENPALSPRKGDTFAEAAQTQSIENSKEQSIHNVRPEKNTVTST